MHSPEMKSATETSIPDDFLRQFLVGFICDEADHHSRMSVGASLENTAAAIVATIAERSTLSENMRRAIKIYRVDVNTITDVLNTLAGSVRTEHWATDADANAAMGDALQGEHLQRSVKTPWIQNQMVPQDASNLQLAQPEALYTSLPEESVVKALRAGVDRERSRRMAHYASVDEPAVATVGRDCPVHNTTDIFKSRDFSERCTC